MEEEKDIHKETAELSNKKLLDKVSKGCKLVDGKLVHKTVEVQESGMVKNFKRIYGGKKYNG